jgi:methyl-accepting chemotaxis protein
MDTGNCFSRDPARHHWVSYILPRQVIKPLLSLKEAVDHAAQGNFEIEFDVQGKGEIVDLVDSLRSMLVAVRQKA